MSIQFDFFEHADVIAAMCLAFFGLVQLLLNYLDRRYRNSTKGKLVLEDIRVLKELGQDGWYSIGFCLRNQSIHPVVLEVIELKTEIQNLTPMEKDYARKDWNIGAGMPFWFDNYGINIRLSSEKRAVGFLHAKLRFGRKGIFHAKHILEFKEKIFIWIDSGIDTNKVKWFWIDI